MKKVFLHITKFQLEISQILFGSRGPETCKKIKISCEFLFFYFGGIFGPSSDPILIFVYPIQTCGHIEFPILAKLHPNGPYDMLSYTAT